MSAEHESHAQEPIKVRFDEHFSPSFNWEWIKKYGTGEAITARCELENVGNVEIELLRARNFDDVTVEARATPAGPVEIKYILRGGEETEEVLLPIELASFSVACKNPEQAKQLKCMFICNNQVWKGVVGDQPALKAGDFVVYEWRPNPDSREYTCYFPDNPEVFNQIKFIITTTKNPINP